MPAAAVIPAPIAYIKVVAVKKLVVGSWVWSLGPPLASTLRPVPFAGVANMALTGWVVPSALLL